MNKTPVSPAILCYAYLKHLEYKTKGHVCELKECAGLVEEVGKLIKQK